MKNVLAPVVRLILASAAAAAFLVAPSVLMLAHGGAEPVAQRCYNGVVPLNPYVRSCTIPGPFNKIRGSAPDAYAIIACRDEPWCLSWYVNNP